MKRYIGNKEKLLQNIEDFIEENSIEATSLIDLYSGTGSVAAYFRTKYDVIANDIMNYSFVVLKAKLSFNSVPKFEKFVREFGIDPMLYLNKKKAKKNNNSIVWKNFSPAGERKYFTEENALKIDGARIEIDSLLERKIISKNEWYYLLACIISAANSKGNTTGTFGAYLKEFSNSSKKPIEFKHIELVIGNKGTVFSKDGKELLKEVKGDILYLDPPYTAIDYSQAYHFLESLSLYNLKEYVGITGRRPHNEKVSNYTKKITASKELEETLRNAECVENVILSYSTHGIIPLSEIKRIFKNYYKEVIVKKIEYPKYRNVYQNDKGKLFELLILGKGRLK